MRSLSSIATSCGYTVLVEASPTCIELTGNGRWHILEHEAYRYVKHSLRDHVSIIIRDPLGGRELVDLGKKGERRAILPSNRCKWEREKHLLGVKVSGKKWTAEVMDGNLGHRKSVYLGTFDDQISAGMARDRYCIEHNLQVSLNFPHMRELVKRDLETVGAE